MEKALQTLGRKTDEGDDTKDEELTEEMHVRFSLKVCKTTTHHQMGDGPRHGHVKLSLSSAKFGGPPAPPTQAGEQEGKDGEEEESSEEEEAQEEGKISLEYTARQKNGFESGEPFVPKPSNRLECFDGFAVELVGAITFAMMGDEENWWEDLRIDPLAS